MKDAMIFCRIVHMLVLAVIITACLFGCSHQKPPMLSIYNDQTRVGEMQQSAPDAKHSKQTAVSTLTPFQRIVAYLILDSLGMLPKKISDQLLDEIQDGITVPDQHDVIDKNVLSSQHHEDVALIAGLIAQRLYGKKAVKEITIPQAILYSQRKNVDYDDLANTAFKLNNSDIRTLDAYNACLNLLVNILCKNYSISSRPNNGLYVRDSMHNLYFHTHMPSTETAGLFFY